MNGVPPSTAPLAAAPPFVWIVVLLVVLLWWLWPLLQQLSASFAEKPPGVACAGGGSHAEPEHAADETHTRASEVEEVAMTGEGDENLNSPDFMEVDDLTMAMGPHFDILAEFGKAFEEAALSISETLYGDPQSLEYKAGAAALHRVIDIVDRIFKALSSESELAKVTRLREATDSFKSSFGDHRVGNAARRLLNAAGFERRLDGFWVFPAENPRARFQAMCVRLCLQKHVDLQKRRGQKVWTQTDNMDVVPELTSASLSELLWLYHSDSTVEPGYSPSWKEKATESTTCAKLIAFRSEQGCSVPLALHDSLTSVARKIANARRTSSRTNNGERFGILVAGMDSEARALLGKLPLPPGCIVGKLEYATSDLPHVFGMTSTTGASNNDGSTDKTADILANEAVHAWRTKEANTMMWPSAVVCGIGASLDYTINRGFIVVLLAGFEGCEVSEQLGALKRKENLDMKERLAAASKNKGPGFGARVHDLSSLRDNEPRRRRGPGGG